MIEVKNITKRYGSQKAVEDVSFCVNEGEILGFLGPNGAGKSTVMNIITGYISSTSGKVLVDGKDIVEAPAYAKKQMGYLPEIPPLYEDMTVKEYLYFIYDLKKCKLPKISHMKDICSLVGIDSVYNRVIKNLSKGYKQRVGFAQALVGDPKILILDEPTVGLDPRQIAEIRSLIKKLGKKHTVILSSHILPEIQAVCDRIVVINHGRIVADDTEENILTSFEEERKLFLTVEGAGRETIRSAVEKLKGVKTVSFAKERKSSLDVEITAQKDCDIRKAVFDTAAKNGWTILEMRSSKLTLEEIFIRLTESGTDVQEEVG
ncbi:ATP-binding cassette domain-containing protein [Ruminococcus sp. FC2018]|uniref:ABC transporter ATP-binding protein n=1 Tax=Ruminococcus sp. FC2018 TaxID=1410617 RepID=UPI00048B7CFE|nr:ATP-binding cassette domain-containing protein [Ruminococcus sp. FC2018]